MTPSLLVRKLYNHFDFKNSLKNVIIKHLLKSHSFLFSSSTEKHKNKNKNKNSLKRILKVKPEKVRQTGSRKCDTLDGYETNEMMIMMRKRKDCLCNWKFGYKGWNSFVIMRWRSDRIAFCSCYTTAKA